MVHALQHAFETLDRDSGVRVVVLTGEGDTFSCGAPRELLLRLAAGEVRPTDILLPRLLLDCPVPVVAAMAGHATGGGFALGLAADIVLIGDDSRYGFTFMNLGFTPGMGTTRLCEHVLSAAVAHELLYTGELRRGRAFAGSGINHVLPRHEVEAAAQDIAARIAEKPRQAVAALSARCRCRGGARSKPRSRTNRSCIRSRSAPRRAGSRITMWNDFTGRAVS